MGDPNRSVSMFCKNSDSKRFTGTQYCSHFVHSLIDFWSLDSRGLCVTRAYNSFKAPLIHKIGDRNWKRN